ncbi:tetratricopeptide repeat protein [Arthrospira platensis BEA 1257B]
MTASDFSQGNKLLRSNQLEEAVVAYQKAIALHPNFPGFQ